jgi:histidinol-phosphatase
MNASIELQTAIKAAQAGEKIALKYFQTDLEIKTKTDNSILTIADIETEKAIKKHITKQFPDAKFLAEESGGNTKENDFWIIDPIDGTRLFAKGIPFWSILIAHYKDGEINLGVCAVPGQKRLLVAEKGKGAFLNGKRVNVSTQKNVKGAFGSFGSLHRFKSPDPILKLTKKEAILRSYEHAYALTFLAAGNMDVVIDSYGTPWDYAPFVRIISEAGGKVTDFEGKSWNLNTKNLVVTNGLLHGEVIKIINSK